MIGKYFLFALSLLTVACVSGMADEDMSQFEEDPTGNVGGTGNRTSTGGSTNGSGGTTVKPGSGGSSGSTNGSGGTNSKGGSSNGSGGTTNPDPNKPCDFPKYQKGNAYQVGDKVIFNGKAYEAIDPNAGQGDPVNSPALWSEYTQCKVEIPPCQSVPGCPLEKVGGCKWFENAFPSRHELYTYAGACEAMKAFPGFASSGDDNRDKNELAAFFGNASHETGLLQHVEELAQTAAPYYGRGPLQITHQFNYQGCGDALGVPQLVSNPDMLATDPVLTWKCSLWFWMTYRGPTGENCHEVIVNGSFGRTIVVINGCESPESRVSYFLDFCNQFGIPAGSRASTSC